MAHVTWDNEKLIQNIFWKTSWEETTHKTSA